MAQKSGLENTVALSGSKARQLIVRALDQWEQIVYYHQLIENRFDQDSLENLLLHQECYLKLVQEHHIQLDKTLRDLRKQLCNNGGASEK